MLPRFLRKHKPPVSAGATTETASRTRQAIGEQGEQRALQYLQRQGLRLVQANYRCRGGEIDLIMHQPASGQSGRAGMQEACLIFVEVRVRGRSDYGGAAASVTLTKQRRVLLAAQHFLARHPDWLAVAQRCDVVALDGTALEWLPNAFGIE